jgi:homocysteine S-methyltransferase
MRSSVENPIISFLDQQGLIILDGGLATALETRGYDLDDPLWSAKILIESPDAIRQLHLDYLKAGADCITTASYQASLPGFSGRDLSEQEGAELIGRSVELAVEARDQFWDEPSNRPGRLRPLVAASVGPYGAYLTDGSEYTGDYQLSETALYDFHLKRWRILAESRADLLACETIPSHQEAGVLLKLLRETPGRWAWFSFSCRSGTELSDGSRLSELAGDCDTESQVAAVGINCTAPHWISSLIQEARRGTDKPIVVYPNSGELYDPIGKRWLEGSVFNWEAGIQQWRQAGAVGIGGCCRIGPVDIARMRCQLID